MLHLFAWVTKLILRGSNFIDNVKLVTTVHFLRAREPFGVSPPLARLDSAAQLTLALDSLSLTSPRLAALRLRCGHPALHPSTSTLASSRRLLPSLPASESGPWSSAESTLFATSAWLRAHPRDSTAARSFPPPLLLQPRCRHYRQRRRRLLRTSPHPNPYLEDTSTLKTPYRLAEATLESAT